MESKSNKLKQILSQEDNQLPPNLDWEQMEDGILKKMDELEEKPVNNFSLRNRFLTAAVIIIAIALIPILCNRTFNKNGSDFHSPISTNQTVSESTDLLEEYAASANKTEPRTSTNLEASDQVKNTAISATRTKPTEKINSKLIDSNPSANIAISSSSSLGSSNDSSDNLTNNTEHKKSITYTINPTEKINNISLIESASKPITNKDLASSSSELYLKDPSKNTSLETPTSSIVPSKLTSLKLENIFQEIEVNTNYFPTLDAPVLNFSAPAKKLNTLNGRLTLLSGVSRWNMGLGNAKPQREEFEQTTASFNAQLNYIHRLKKNWAVMIGFQYQQLESRFEQNVALENYSVTLTDTVLQILVKSTGEEEKVYGDTTLAVSAMRQVKYHNTSRLYQIPFAVGQTWSMNKWQTDLLIGGSINVFSQNKGLTLIENELQTYDGSNTDFINNQWKLNAMIAGRLTYNINNHFGITSGIQFQRNLTNWSKEQNLKMNPNVISLELGLSFKL